MNVYHLQLNPLTSKANALQRHLIRIEAPAEEAIARSNLPPSEVNPDEVLEWADTQKPLLKEIETDVHDAKRRIAAAKGPKKKTPAGEEAQEGTSSESGKD